jgi:AcrR family transcriptional regulator
MTNSSTVLPARPPLRRDAAENRKSLLAAAAQVFARDGLGAPVEEIARVAGLGIGTLYRRFPTKEALIAELVQGVLEHMSALADDAMELAGGLGLETFLEAASAYQAAHRGCLPRLWNTAPDNEALVRVRRTIAVLLTDAQRHGRIRNELTSTDFTLVMWSIRGVIETTRDAAPDAWRRHFEILLAGLRPSRPTLWQRPLTRLQVDRTNAISG